MNDEVDFILVGTGVAPLVSAYRLLSAGKSVLVLNPLQDFFSEKSELKFDPFFLEDPQEAITDRLNHSLPLQAHSALSKYYPGSIELWPQQLKNIRGDLTGNPVSKFHDYEAPHVRERSCIWMYSDQSLGSPLFAKKWEMIEDLYLEVSSAGMKVDVLEGLIAAKKFPGFSGRIDGGVKGVLIPRLYDVDVSLYQQGILEFLIERMGARRVLTGVNGLELVESGISFRDSDSNIVTIEPKEALFMYWTPKITRFVQNSVNKFSKNKSVFVSRLPKGVRVWEDWQLVSREGLEAHTIGIFENMVVSSNFEGAPDNPSNQMLEVMLKGNLLTLSDYAYPFRDYLYASGSSIDSISRLCEGFLNWEYVTVRKLTVRELIEWSDSDDPADSVFTLDESKTNAHIVLRCDGPLLDVVTQAANVVEEFV